MKPQTLWCIGVTIGLALMSSAHAAQNAAGAGGLSRDEMTAVPGVRLISFEDLVPPNFRPGEIIARHADQVRQLSDDDPRAKKALAQLQEIWVNAPVVQSLNGQAVKMSGFVVPLEGDGKSVTQFLLVPHFGACIHTPPPPSNQIVLVRALPNLAKINRLFEIVWVTGRMKTERVRSDIASAGYVLEATKVEPF